LAGNKAGIDPRRERVERGERPVGQGDAPPRGDRLEARRISLAGVAATRRFAAAGAGGIALTAWALRRSWRSRRELLGEITTFYLVLYAIFMAALVLAGAGLRTGILSGPAPFGLTVVPAIFGASVIVGVLFTAELPRDLDERVRRRSPGDRPSFDDLQERRADRRR
jgi:hypothetical protein